MVPAPTRLWTFWRLQAIGWSSFALVVVALTVPSGNQPAALLDAVLWVIMLAGASVFLRRLCRRWMERSLPLPAFASRAAAWSVVFGVLTAVTPDSLFHIRGLALDDWLVGLVQAVVVLFLWCTLYFACADWERTQAERERWLAAEAKARDARLALLRAQLHPHFLFNALNAVSTLVLERQTAQATRMLAQIGDILRASLDSTSPHEVSLAAEFALARQYLDIEQVRLGERLRVRCNIGPGTEALHVPSMILQPLVENAVRHGVAPERAGGEIRLDSRDTGGSVLLVVGNSGRPCHAPSLADLRRGPGIGLTNTLERLQTLYGERQSLAIVCPVEGGWEVRIQIPARRGAAVTGATIPCAC
jgi:hypothetical protein